MKDKLEKLVMKFTHDLLAIDPNAYCNINLLANGDLIAMSGGHAGVTSLLSLIHTAQVNQAPLTLQQVMLGKIKNASEDELQEMIATAIHAAAMMENNKTPTGETIQ